MEKCIAVSTVTTGVSDNLCTIMIFGGFGASLLYSGGPLFYITILKIHPCADTIPGMK